MIIKRLILCLYVIIIGLSHTTNIGYTSQELNGIIKSNDGNGKLISEISYKNGKRDGWSIYYQYTDDGKRYISEKTHYRDDKKNGWSVIPGSPYEPRRNKEQYYYLNDVKHGWSFIEKYIGEGFMKEKAMYRNGKKLGKIYQYWTIAAVTKKIINGYIDEHGTLFNDGILRAPFTLSSSTGNGKDWPEALFGYSGSGRDYYHSDNLIDEIKETVWVAGDYYNLNEVYFYLKKKNERFAKKLVIVNGNRENNSEYYKFSRIKHAVLTVTIVDPNKEVNGFMHAFVKERKEIYFTDNFEIKKIPINEKRWFDIELRVKSVYPGKQFKNLAVSDFYLEF